VRQQVRPRHPGVHGDAVRHVAKLVQAHPAGATTTPAFSVAHPSMAIVNDRGSCGRNRARCQEFRPDARRWPPLAAPIHVRRGPVVTASG
jgi:hypothetical protein